MVRIKIGTLECSTRQEIIYTLEEIIKCIDNGYHSGLTDGTCWEIEGEEEFEDEYEDEFEE